MPSHAVLAQTECNSNYQDRYAFYQTPMTWADARAFCQSLNRTDLAVINSDEELHYLKNVTTGDYWIGLSDDVEDGKTATYTNSYTLFACSHST